MLVRVRKPPEGARKFVFKGDEAVVRKLTSGGYEGMAERVQGFELIRGTSVSFGLSCDGRNISRIGSTELTYHILKFASLVLAKAIFPYNFINARELRLYNEGKCSFSAMYSDFIEDENGVNKRRRRFMDRFYTHARTMDAECERSKFGREEQGMNPELARIIERIKRAGLAIPHPEANYQISNGQTVFLEIKEIEIDNVLRTIDNSHEKTLVMIQTLAKIYALAIKRWAERKPESDYNKVPFHELEFVVTELFKREIGFVLRILREEHEVLHRPFDGLILLAGCKAETVIREAARLRANDPTNWDEVLSF